MQQSLTVPIFPIPDWVNSVEGYIEHQELLQMLVNYLIEKGIKVELPENTDGHDNGIDLYVGEERVIVDLKSFWLTRGDKRQWMSGFHKKTRGRIATWEGKATEAYIHADRTPTVDQWLVGRACGLTVEDGVPQYSKSDVVPLGKLIG